MVLDSYIFFTQRSLENKDTSVLLSLTFQISFCCDLDCFGNLRFESNMKKERKKYLFIGSTLDFQKSK